MRTRRRLARLGLALVSVALVASACASSTPDEGSERTEPKDGPTITVGSANFSESIILAEIYKQALEAEGYPVETKHELGSREIYFPALESGDVDLLPEYTGALVRFLTSDQASASADEEATYQALVAALQGKGVAALDRSSAQDKDAVVVTKALADEHGLTKVSDLKPIAGDLVFGGSPECPERPSCLKGLREVYGLEFKEVKTLDTAGPVTVAALEGDEVQVSLLFTTQGVIAEKGFVVLDDDMGIEVSQNILPVVRQEILDAYGSEVSDLINSVTAAMTTEQLTEMNKRADVDKDDPEVIAKEWLAAYGPSA